MKEGAERHTEQPATEQRRAVLKVGGYSNLMLAEQDARQFLMPTVFQNRSGIFPDPRNFRLTVTPEEARALAWTNPPSPMNTHYVEVTIMVAGVPASIDKWVQRTENNLRVTQPSSYGDTSERMAHLRERGQASPLRRGVATPVESQGGEREKHLRETGRGNYPKEGARLTKRGDGRPNPHVRGGPEHTQGEGI